MTSASSKMLYVSSRYWIIVFNDKVNIFLLLKEINVLFNEAFNTFYLQIHGIGRMAEDYSDRENPLPPLHGLLFPISSM